MKKGKILLLPMFIVAALCIAAIIGGLIFMMRSPESEKEQDQRTAMFDKHEINDLTVSGLSPGLDGNYRTNEAKAFGYSGEAEYVIKDENISAIVFNANLIESKDINASDAEIAVRKFVETYSNDKGFPIIETPQIIQFADDETYKSCPENLYEALIKGYVLLEYSYRDADGVLWIAQVYSPRDEMLCGTINKYLDMSGYVDFEPQINLQKEVVE